MFDRMQTNDEKEKNEMNPTDVSDAKENNKSKKSTKKSPKEKKTRPRTDERNAAGYVAVRKKKPEKK